MKAESVFDIYQGLSQSEKNRLRSMLNVSEKPMQTKDADSLAIRHKLRKMRITIP
jgi:hypothetical protein